MKKLLPVMMMFLAPVLAVADPPGEDVHRPSVPTNGTWYVQLDGGVNFSLLNGNPAFRRLEPGESPTTLFNSANGLAPYVAATVGYQANDNIGVSFSAAYDARHTARKATLLDTCTLWDFETGEGVTSLTDIQKDYRVDASYLSLSLLGNLRFDNLYLFAGPTASIPLGHKVAETNRILDTLSDCTYLFNTPHASKVISGELNAKENLAQRFSLKLGAGYVFEINKQISIVPQIAYDLGFKDLLKQDEVLMSETPEGANAGGVIVNRAMRMSAVQATVGLRINL